MEMTRRRVENERKRDGQARMAVAYYGEHLLEVVLNQFVIENMVLLGHGGHESVLGHVRGACAVLVVRTLGLFVEGLDIGRKQAVETEAMALVFTEAGAFVVVRMIEHMTAHIRTG